MWLSFESASGGSGGSPSPARDDRRTALLRRGAEGGYLRGSLAGHELRGGHEHKCGHRADSGNDPCKEQDLVETRKESLPCNRHQVWRDRTGKASERHSIGEPPRLIRGNPRDQLGDPALRPRQKERAHRRSSCRDPDLTKRVVDSRGDAALLLRHRAESDIGEHWVDDPDAHSAKQQAEKDAGPVVTFPNVGHQNETNRDESESECEEHTRCHLCHRNSRERRDQECGDSYGKKPQPRAHRRLTEKI